jgi:potassium efflux system protein
MRSPTRNAFLPAPAAWLLLLMLCSLPLQLPASARQLGGLGGTVTGQASPAGVPPEQAIAEALAAAEAADDEAQALSLRLQDLHAEAANAPKRSSAFEAELAVDRGQSLRLWQAQLPTSADVDTLEALLEQERLAAEQLRAQIDALTSQLAQNLALPSRNTPQTADLQRRLDELAAPVVAARGEAEALTEARRLRNDAERRKIKAELALQLALQDQAGARQRLQELELRALRHRLSLRQPRMAFLQQRIADMGRTELEGLAAGLAQRAQAQQGAEPVLAEAAAANSALGKELTQSNERLASRRRALANEEEALTRDLAGLRDSRTRLDLGGRSEEVGVWLWAELRRLESPDELRKRLSDVQATLAELRLRLIGLAEDQRRLDDLAEAAADLRDTAIGADDEHGHAQTGNAAALESLLQERVDLMARLEPILWRRIAVLEQTERTLQSRIATTAELQQLLDRHLLWIRSHPPVSSTWLEQVPAGFYDLLKPARFVTTAALVKRSFAERPWAYLGSALLVLGLLLLQRRARPRLIELSQSIRSVRTDRFAYSLQSLFWTVMGALPWPVALFLVGHLLQGVGTAGKFSDSLGRSLVALVLPFFTFLFLRWLVRERGLAHAHLRWTKLRRQSIAKWVPWLVALFLPLYFVVALAFVRNQDLALSVTGRLALVLMAILSAWVLWDMLGPRRLWHTRGVDLEPSRMRRLLRALLPPALLGVAALALAGYVYSSAIVMISGLSSVRMLVAVAIVVGLLGRWFVLGERRLALRRQTQRREAEAIDGDGEQDGGEAIPLEAVDEITLEKISTQNRSLLRALKLTLLVLGLAWVWADVLPAFARFDEIPLWNITETAVDGSKSLVPVTLMSALLGLVTLALTVVAARNLPGLIEVGLLSRVSIDAASRYAITSVSRYAIVLVGVVVGVGLLGARWSQLQWMAAALTLGLGFGLQEIFANFVSGLILLFERPFRVGDVITVNGLDGTVTRIRTRATTILDFDNKEIVVPNKTFITGQLVNWTLTEETTRVTIKIGVDYGTNPALVHRLLQQAAAENPRVLSDRPPTSWLLNFGASTMEFELRVFVPTMNDRLAVRNELNSRLIELFEQNGIAFAYPQLDVHVKHLPETRPAAPDAPAPRS